MIEPLHKEKISALITQLAGEKIILLTDHYYRDVWNISGTPYLLHEGKLSKIKGLDELVALGYLPDR